MYVITRHRTADNGIVWSNTVTAYERDELKYAKRRLAQEIRENTYPNVTFSLGFVPNYPG